jgi:hypothetical protein
MSGCFTLSSITRPTNVLRKRVEAFFGEELTGGIGYSMATFLLASRGKAPAFPHAHGDETHSHAE